MKNPRNRPKPRPQTGIAGKSPRARRRHDPRGLTILHEDQDILVVDKVAGLLTMGTNRERSKTAYSALTDYVRKGNPKSRERVFIVHRLDREVSGILVFARSPQAKRTLQDNWEAVEKHYLALVHGLPKKGEGVLSSHLVETGVHRVQSTKDASAGKLSRTAYRVLGHSRGITLLDIHLLTGRKHQIRVQLAEANIPLVGDRKYGTREGKDASRLALHAYSLAFAHPYTGAACRFETPIPALFAKVPRSRKD